MQASSAPVAGVQKIRSFTDLTTWQEAHKLVLAIYTLTKAFPKEEMFGLTSQMRRAAISITSNIAEGFNRRSNKEKIHFYYMSLSSLTEIQNQLIASKDIGYLSSEKFSQIAESSVVVSKLLNGLIKSIER
jgi:four helix bundle protein